MRDQRWGYVGGMHRKLHARSEAFFSGQALEGDSVAICALASRKEHEAVKHNSRFEFTSDAESSERDLRRGRHARCRVRGTAPSRSHCTD